MATPDLNDPVAAAAYARELGGVMVRTRRAGVALALAGALLLLAAKRGGMAPGWLAAAASVMGLGVMLTLTALFTRSRYHALRMGEGPEPPAG
jgi:hypothetical protein